VTGRLISDEKRQAELGERRLFASTVWSGLSKARVSEEIHGILILGYFSCNTIRRYSPRLFFVIF
jgi:hypothetical protein